MRSIFYVIWALFPLLFLGIALWAKLEQVGNKQKRENPGDFFRQAGFLLVCVVVSIALDQLVLDSIANALAPEYFPPWFFRTLLFPFVIYALARIIGPSKSILIDRATHVTSRKRR